MVKRYSYLDNSTRVIKIELLYVCKNILYIIWRYIIFRLLHIDFEDMKKNCPQNILMN